MIVTVNSQQLAVELRLLNKIVPTKPAIAILSHVLINAEFDALHLYSTDFEVGLSTWACTRMGVPEMYSLLTSTRPRVAFTLRLAAMYFMSLPQKRS